MEAAAGVTVEVAVSGGRQEWQAEFHLPGTFRLKVSNHVTAHAQERR